LGIIFPIMLDIYVYCQSGKVLSSCSDMFRGCFKCLSLQLLDFPPNFLEVVGAYTQGDVPFKVWVATVWTTVEPTVFQFVNV
jgi:hypothetical protein